MNKKQWYEKELVRYRKKVADQQKEISQLRAENETARRAIPELQGVMDGILIQLAKKYGDEVEGAGYLLYLPTTPISDALKEYQVYSRLDELGMRRIIKIVRRK